MLTLMKREPALRWMPLACVLAFAFAVLMFPTFQRVQTLHLSGSTDTAIDAEFDYLILIILPMQWSIFISLRHVSLQTRVLDFERTLPITARSIVLQRAATAWVVMVVPYLAASCVGLVQMPNAQQLSTLATIVGRGLLAITVGVLVLFAYRPRRLQLHTFELVALSVVAIAIALAPGLVESHLVDIALLVLVVILGAHLWTRLAHWTPVEDPRIASPTSPGAAAPLPVRVLGPLRWTLLRSTFLRPNVVIGAVFGGDLLSFAGSEMMFILLWMPAVIVDGSMRQGLNMLHGIDAFPMRRRHLLPFIAVPSLIVIVGSASVRSVQPSSFSSFGMLSRDVALDRQSDETLAGEGEYEHHLRVPPRAWRLASTEAAARITAPWGETTTPQPHPVFWSAATFAYNPYDVRPTSSGRFLMWQISRALSEVHGFEGTPEDVHANWFPDVDLDTPIEGLRFADVGSEDWGFGDSESTLMPNAIGFGALYGVLTWFVIAAFCLRPNTPPRSGGFWPNLVRRQALGGIALMAVVIVLQTMHGSDRALLSILSARLHATMDGALGSSSLLWAALVGSLLVAAYRFLVWRIERIEVPPLVRNGWNKKAFPIF